MKRWVDLELPGPVTEINRQGVIRQYIYDYKKKKVVSIERKPSTAPNGLKYLPLCGSNKYVHRLIAEAFIKNPGRLKFVEFIDGNNKNLDAKNLRWTDSIKYTHPRRRMPSVLLDEDIHSIKARAVNGEKLKTIAADYGVHHTLISHIKAGRRWGHIA